MPIITIILILISASLHTTWNLLAKLGKPSLIFFLLLTFSTTILVAPFLLLNFAALKTIPIKIWCLILVTGMFQTMYYTGLANAYRHGDISLVYPLIRALPVLIVPLVCFLFSIGKTLSIEAIIGMVLIAGGCFIMPIKSFRTWHIRNYYNSAFLWVIPGALGTVGYTIIDSEAMNLLKANAFSVPVNIIYSGLTNIAIIPWLILVTILSSTWKDLQNYRGRKILRPIIGGVTMCLSYTLILAAMKQVDNVSYIASFRQISIPLGVILGVVIFKEKLFLPRIIGCITIVAGLILTAI